MEEEYPECPICLDIFGNNSNHIKAPKILKCGDSICMECLEVIIKNTEEESFLCPACKEKIKKEQYIDDYVTNRVIIKIINDSFNINLNEIKDENQAPIEYNIILLGNTSVGKTSILHRLSEDIFSERISSTIGCDMSAYYIKYKNKKYEVSVARDKCFCVLEYPFNHQARHYPGSAKIVSICHQYFHIYNYCKFLPSVSTIIVSFCHFVIIVVVITNNYSR